MPDCHGKEYSPVGSDGGFCSEVSRLAALGMSDSGSLSSHPRPSRRPAIQNVGAMMLGPMGSPLDSSGWILAKYSVLSL